MEELEAQDDIKGNIKLQMIEKYPRHRHDRMNNYDIFVSCVIKKEMKKKVQC